MLKGSFVHFRVDDICVFLLEMRSLKCVTFIMGRVKLQILIRFALLLRVLQVLECVCGCRRWKF